MAANIMKAQSTKGISSLFAPFLKAGYITNAAGKTKKMWIPR
jgi:hypothetical protein